ncbi:acylphosphatase [Cephaloticoccus capnophilus]|uniref:acylphosphatase n=2 Tax=Cephaloticoccus capnophilus TaxID=1548208 RepID=A0A139SSH6_9BACT|nr:acylphosphatase [Cephaloticoccus capnophilus]
MDNMQYEQVYFSGRVQGVGFRQAVLQAAREFEVAGFVQNLSDGRVLLEVEGKAAEIDGLVSAVEERMHGYVRQTERGEPEQREAVYAGFEIR